MTSYFYLGLGCFAFIVFMAMFDTWVKLSNKAYEAMIVGLIGWMSTIFVGDLIFRAMK
jgi:hypothetical protein